MILFFGCRLKTLDLYAEEKQKMVEEGVLDEVHLALSREPKAPKVRTFICPFPDVRYLYNVNQTPLIAS